MVTAVAGIRSVFRDASALGDVENLSLRPQNGSTHVLAFPLSSTEYLKLKAWECPSQGQAEPWSSQPRAKKDQELTHRGLRDFQIKCRRFAANASCFAFWGLFLAFYCLLFVAMYKMKQHCYLFNVMTMEPLLGVCNTVSHEPHLPQFYRGENSDLGKLGNVPEIT